MKQPDKPKAKQPATQQPAKTADRKQPAAPGALANIGVEAGKPAQAGQPGKISAAPSTLVGDAKGGLPAATAKPADAKPAADKPVTDKKTQPDAVKPAQTPFAKEEAKPTPPPAKPAEKTAVKSAPVKKTGFWPVVFGGVVAAGLGAAAAIYALPHVPPQWQPFPQGGPAAAPQDVAALAQQAARRAVAEEMGAMPAPAGLPADLEDRIAALESRPAAPPPAEGGPQGSEQLDSQLAALTQRLDEQQARLDEMAESGSFDPEAAGALQQQIEAAAAEAESRLEAARTEAQELQSAAEASTRRAEAVAAIASLQSALDRGVTPDDARATLEGAGLDTPEALTVEVPSLTSLQSEFSDAARASLRAALSESSASGEGNMLTNFLRAQTGARSIAAREGDDADAVLSRANAEVEAGRIAPALAEIESLPEAARTTPAMADWLTRATAYTQAQSALTDLSSGQN
ncbi:COG4223 family protein [Paracoccus sp. JM45]|uniref:COG4223 family protein n=1 Tax=Paracoccus sp. JM45 TaxID=2283626 RepID=UPI000E6C7327|nr:hypothetical protein [Paracoccus sp. JM45]RJE80562.1 hypothetical protein DWB67_06770 [Paracoccus sp. JM45]